MIPITPELLAHGFYQAGTTKKIGYDVFTPQALSGVPWEKEEHFCHQNRCGDDTPRPATSVIVGGWEALTPMVIIYPAHALLKRNNDEPKTELLFRFVDLHPHR